MIPGPAVLDTSVVLKWFRQGEVLAGEALALRAAYLAGEIDVVEPPLLAYEVANALRYKSDLSLDQVQEAVESLFGMGWEWIPPSGAVLCRAVELARAFEVTVYDAVFASLAEAEEALFLTADERLARSLEALGFVRFLGSVEREA
jgi:predicted nucleic acid-binding protein